MDQFVILTVLSHPGEAQADFASRLSRFWTHMLRQYPDAFKRVYAETTAFETRHDRLERQYLFEPAIVVILEKELATAGLAHQPLDLEETYSKYEAVSPDWMQIEH